MKMEIGWGAAEQPGRGKRCTRRGTPWGMADSDDRPPRPGVWPPILVPGANTRAPAGRGSGIADLDGAGRAICRPAENWQLRLPEVRATLAALRQRPDLDPGRPCLTHHEDPSELLVLVPVVVPEISQ